MIAQRRKALYLFGALSLALHVAVLGALLSESRMPTWRLGEADSRNGEITIAIGTHAYSASPGSVARTKDISSAVPAPVKANIGATSDMPADSAVDKPSAAIVLGEIRSRLARYLAYPPLARARGWQGTVLVGFRLATDGQLEAIRVARSSGYDILDASALDSLAKVGRLDEFAGTAKSRLQQLELAVMYRLESR